MSDIENNQMGLRSLLQSHMVLFQVDVPGKAHREAVGLPIAVFFAAAAWFSIQAIVEPYVADDAFILFRHVKHLLAGKGAIWDTAYPVEAHSSSLWVLLLALASKFGASLPTSSVILGIGCSSLAMAMLTIATRGLGPLWTRLALVALVTTNPPVTTWTNAGLEMPLALLVVISFVWAMASLWRQPSVGAYAGLFACCLLSVSIRPDLPLQLIACIAALSLFHAAPRRILLVAAGAIVLAGVLLALWRYSYYGDYVPLPQRAKSVIEPINLLRYGRYLLTHGPVLVLATLSVAFLWLRTPTRPQPSEVIATLLAGAIMSEHALLGGDELIRGRFTVQPLALLSIPLVRPLASLAWGRVRSATIVAVGLIIQAWFALHPLPSQDDLCGERREEVGRWIAANSTPDFSIASTSGGYIPFYANRQATDLYGLTHPEAARLTLVRGSTEYGYEVARIAGDDEICGFIVPACGSLAEPTCPLPPQDHRLLAGAVSYLEETPAYEAAIVELESKRSLIIYVRDTCRDRLSGVRYCGANEDPGC